MSDDDDELRRGFSKLRDADARRAPPFTDLVRRGRPRAAPSPWAVAAALSSAAAAAAAVLLWCGVQGASSPPMAAAPAPVVTSTETATPASSSDPEPLGFLLALPGSAALSTADLDTSMLQGESR